MNALQVYLAYMLSLTIIFIFIAKTKLHNQLPYMWTKYRPFRKHRCAALKLLQPFVINLNFHW